MLAQWFFRNLKLITLCKSLGYSSQTRLSGNVLVTTFEQSCFIIAYGIITNNGYPITIFVDSTSKTKIVKVITITHLGWSGNLKPSSDQVIDGVGFPDALHFNDTVGPGCRVCSMNVYSMVGNASAGQNIIDHVQIWQ